MKFTITFRDVDAMFDKLREQVASSVTCLDLEEEEVDAVFELRLDRVTKALSRWVERSEAISVEFDLSNNTATVLECEVEDGV